MSGFVGVIRTDGAPVEPVLVRRLTASMTLHGPDARTVRSKGPVGLGHALLRMPGDAVDGSQPLSLDGTTWIVTDARIDDRRALACSLGRGSGGRSAAELILAAYARWGEDCVDHLLGDFAFAIWDEREQVLFCARDHMGVKPFYYAHLGHWLVISNALECVRRHPAVSRELNDRAIADFLLFGVNRERATTSFRDVQRLPAAHCLKWCRSGLRVHQYWTLPIDEPSYHRRDHDYGEQFQALLRQAVSDRVQGDRVSVLMSGGLDSTALAGTALEVIGGTRPCLEAGFDARDPPVKAFTFVYDSLIPDEERRYADSVGAHLGVPIHYCVLDDAHRESPSMEMRTPEPIGMRSDPGFVIECYAAMAAHSRVAFFGEGPDNALWYEWRAYLAYLFRGRRWRRLITDVAKHLTHHRRVPLVASVPRLLKDRVVRKRYEPVFPRWLAGGLVERLQLEERWRALNVPVASPHPVRPEAYASFQDPRWQAVFEAFTPACTRAPMEVRHPYMDIRMLRFLLSLPTLPWCRSKHVLRCALRGSLPEPVRLRRKTTLAADPEYMSVKRHGLPSAFPSAQLAVYADLAKLSPPAADSVPAMKADLRLVALSYWLRDCELKPRCPAEESIHGLAEEPVEAGQR